MARPAAAMLLACVALTGCSDDGSVPQGGAGDGIGAPVRSANCTDWKKAGPSERRQSLDQIRAFAGGPVEQGGHGNTLDDDKAYRLFENWCSHDYARGFKLYKLYTRAAAFSPRR